MNLSLLVCSRLDVFLFELNHWVKWPATWQWQASQSSPRWSLIFPLECGSSEPSRRHFGGARGSSDPTPVRPSCVLIRSIHIPDKCPMSAAFYMSSLWPSAGITSRFLRAAWVRHWVSSSSDTDWHLSSDSCCIQVDCPGRKDWLQVRWLVRASARVSFRVTPKCWQTWWFPQVGHTTPLCGGGLLGVWSQDLPVLSIEWCARSQLGTCVAVHLACAWPWVLIWLILRSHL